MDPPDERSVAASVAALQQDVQVDACFGAAYAALAAPTGCAAVSQGGKRRLALAFTLCHLVHAGRRVPSQECDVEGLVTRGGGDAATPDDTERCLAALSQEGFGAYTAYMTHTDNLCFYLQSRAWREGTAALIARLAATAASTTDMLTAVAAASRDLKLATDAALRDNQRAWNASATLAALHHESTKEVAAMTAAMRTDAAAHWEQYRTVARLLDQLATYSSAVLALQGYIVSHLLTVQLVGFYALAAGTVFLLTSSPASHPARLPMYLSLLAAGAMEGYAVFHANDVASMVSNLVTEAAATATMEGGVAGGHAAGMDAGGGHANRTSMAGGGGHEQGGSSAWMGDPFTSTSLAGVVMSLRMALLVAAVQVYVWIRSALPGWSTLLNRYAHPALMMAVFDGAHGQAWQLSTLQWGIRYAWIMYAGLTLMAHTWRTRQREERVHAAVLRMESQVDDLHAWMGSLRRGASVGAHPTPSPWAWWRQCGGGWRRCCARGRVDADRSPAPPTMVAAPAPPRLRLPLGVEAREEDHDAVTEHDKHEGEVDGEFDAGDVPMVPLRGRDGYALRPSTLHHGHRPATMAATAGSGDAGWAESVSQFQHAVDVGWATSSMHRYRSITLPARQRAMDEGNAGDVDDDGDSGWAVEADPAAMPWYPLFHAHEPESASQLAALDACDAAAGPDVWNDDNTDDGSDGGDEEEGEGEEGEEGGDDPQALSVHGCRSSAARMAERGGGVGAGGVRFHGDAAGEEEEEDEGMGVGGSGPAAGVGLKRGRAAAGLGVGGGAWQPTAGQTGGVGEEESEEQGGGGLVPRVPAWQSGVLGLPHKPGRGELGSATTTYPPNMLGSGGKGGSGDSGGKRARRM